MWNFTSFRLRGTLNGWPPGASILIATETLERACEAATCSTLNIAFAAGHVFIPGISVATAAKTSNEVCTPRATIEIIQVALDSALVRGTVNCVPFTLLVCCFTTSGYYSNCTCANRSGLLKDRVQFAVWQPDSKDLNTRGTHGTMTKALRAHPRREQMPTCAVLPQQCAKRTVCSPTEGARN